MSTLKRLNIKLNAIKFKNSKVSKSQAQTRDTFAFKWARRNTYESKVVKENAKRWLLERYCNNDRSMIDKWLSGDRKIILDVGCGSGFTSSILFGSRLKEHDYLGIDISDAVYIAQERFLKLGIPADFLKINLFDLPIPKESVDIIYSEGVLHHTDNTNDAIKYLAKKLKKGGRFLFYVYAKKAPMREFSDDYIRRQLNKMNDKQAWGALKPLTKLGMALGKMNIKLKIPEDIDFLGIRKGKVDIQRFFYWNICKMFYHSGYSLEEMNHVNFDWFRPLNCHRHTPKEIKAYCKNAKLKIERFNVQESGITIVAKK